MRSLNYTIEELETEALKYNSKIDFLSNGRTYYRAAHNMGILDNICQHMKKARRDWSSDESVFLEAKIYNSRIDFRKGSSGAYGAALGRDILDKVCSHMDGRSWTREELEKIALTYKTRGEFQVKHCGAYIASRKLKILNEICSHMEIKKNKFSNEELKHIALKYNSRNEFKSSNTPAYRKSIKQNILDEICSHMTGGNEYRTDEELGKSALKFDSRGDFQKGDNGAWQVARNRNILDKICEHMKKAGGTSNPEEELLNEIKKLYPKAQKLRDRKAKIEGKPYIKGFDIDIYVPELRKGIEFDGTYWHSVEGLKRCRKQWSEEELINYHKTKDDYFKSRGIDLLHIKEEIWLNNKMLELEKCLNFLRTS